jgi:hypothetical protein
MIPWKKEWQNMPEYSHEDLSAKFQVIINFAFKSDVEEFAKLINQNISTEEGRQTKSLWFPRQEIARYVTKRYAQREDYES